MKLKELKNILNQYPSEYDDYEVEFGNVFWGAKLKRLQKLGRKIILSFF